MVANGADATAAHLRDNGENAAKTRRAALLLRMHVLHSQYRSARAAVPGGQAERNPVSEPPASMETGL